MVILPFSSIPVNVVAPLTPKNIPFKKIPKEKKKKGIVLPNDSCSVSFTVVTVEFLVKMFEKYHNLGVAER